MNSWLIVAAGMIPGMVTGFMLGAKLRRKRRRPGPDQALVAIFAGAAVWLGLEYSGLRLLSAGVYGLMCGWVIANGGWAFLGRRGLWRPLRDRAPASAGASTPQEPVI